MPKARVNLTVDERLLVAFQKKLKERGMPLSTFLEMAMMENLVKTERVETAWKRLQELSKESEGGSITNPEAGGLIATMQENTSILFKSDGGEDDIPTIEEMFYSEAPHV